MTAQKKSCKPYLEKELYKMMYYCRKYQCVYQTERELKLYMHCNGKHSKERRKIVSFPFVVIVLSTHCKKMTDTVK